MFKIEHKLDKIINILYDENLLHWNEVPATDFIAYIKPKFKIKWSDAEINFILSILQNDNYIVLNKKDINNMEMPTFSLTAKGVQMKRNGGFFRAKINSLLTNYVIIWASIFTIVTSFNTILHHYKIKDWKDNTLHNNEYYNCPTPICIPETITDKLSNKPTFFDTIKHNTK